MADMDKDRLKELEIESILEETHYLADQERMEQTAQKYRAKPKIEEIFSNADKKPRLKNTNPLDESEPDTQWRWQGSASGGWSACCPAKRWHPKCPPQCRQSL